MLFHLISSFSTHRGYSEVPSVLNTLISHHFILYQVGCWIVMNSFNYDEVDILSLTEEEKDDKVVISEFATGSMDMDANTDMNKNTADDLNFGEQDVSMPDSIFQQMDSQENAHQGFQVMEAVNCEVTYEPLDLPFCLMTQNNTMDNMIQDADTSDDCSLESKKIEQNNLEYHFKDLNDLILYPASNEMNDSTCPTTTYNSSDSDCSDSDSICSTTSYDGSVSGYSQVNTSGMSSSTCDYVHEDSVGDSSNGAYSEGQEEGLVAKDDEEENDDGNRTVRPWTEKENELLKEAVKLYGTRNNWRKIAAYVGKRNASQCVNKWKNRRSDGWKKWNKAATEVLRGLIKQGLSFHEIQERMSDYTYIQIYQHHQKLAMNSEPWEKWEVELLIKLKKEGKLSDTQIGKKLNNRHKDSVKCKWNEINKK